VTSEKLVFEEETIILELIGRKFSVDGVDLRELVTDDFETREGTVRARLERHGIAA